MNAERGRFYSTALSLFLFVGLTCEKTERLPAPAPINTPLSSPTALLSEHAFTHQGVTINIDSPEGRKEFCRNDRLSNPYFGNTQAVSLRNDTIILRFGQVEGAGEDAVYYYEKRGGGGLIEWKIGDQKPLPACSTPIAVIERTTSGTFVIASGSLK